MDARRVLGGRRGRGLHQIVALFSNFDGFRSLSDSPSSIPHRMFLRIGVTIISGSLWARLDASCEIARFGNFVDNARRRSFRSRWKSAPTRFARTSYE